MKKQLLALLAVALSASTVFAALQVTKVTLNPAPQCGAGATTTATITVVGGTAPYTFSASGVTPTVSGNTATFVFPVANTDAAITITDSSTPAQTATCGISLRPQLFTTATWTLVSPCTGQSNGAITIAVTGTAPFDFFVQQGSGSTTRFPAAGAFAHTFTGLPVGTYTCGATTTAAASCAGGVNFTEIFNVQLVAFDTSFITDLTSFITYVNCQKCITRTPVTTSTRTSSCCNNSCSSSCNNSCGSSCC